MNMDIFPKQRALNALAAERDALEAEKSDDGKSEGGRSGATTPVPGFAAQSLDKGKTTDTGDKNGEDGNESDDSWDPEGVLFMLRFAFLKMICPSLFYSLPYRNLDSLFILPSPSLAFVLASPFGVSPCVQIMLDMSSNSKAYRCPICPGNIGSILKATGLNRLRTFGSVNSRPRRLRKRSIHS